jgi:hypothetical protein
MKICPTNKDGVLFKKIALGMCAIFFVGSVVHRVYVNGQLAVFGHIAGIGEPLISSSGPLLVPFFFILSATTENVSWSLTYSL